MRVTAIVAATVAVAVIWAAGSPAASAEAANQNEKSSKSKHVVVEKGDSLSKIARAEDTTYKRLFYANKHIKDPDLIYPGDKVRIPRPGEQLKQRPLQTNPPQQSSQRTAEPKRTGPAPKPKQTTSSQPTQRSQKPAPKPAGTVSGSIWDKLAQCESSGNWSINTGNGYYGGLQFTLSSWRAVGGSGYPHHASKSEQIARAEKLQAIQGWNAWPACSAKLGLR